MLYSTSNGKISVIKESKFNNEKELQAFVEKHMSELLNLTFLDTEYYVNDSLRVDSIAYDPEVNSFVLIEDKVTRNSGIVDQGFAYLAALFDRKDRATLLYNKVMNATKQTIDFDWSQTRIIFISPDFNDYQINSTSFNDLPFDLYELKNYGNIISFNRIDNKNKKLNYKLTVGSRNSEREPLDEIKVYTEDDMFPNESEHYELYQLLREHITSLNNVTIKPGKSAIAYFVNGRRFAGCDSQKSAIRLFINNPKKGIDDPFHMCHDIKTRAWGNYAWEIKITNNVDFNKVMLLVKQSYDDVQN